VSVDDSCDQRLLGREVLVERTDADARERGDLVGARPVIAVLHQNASGRFEQGFDGQT
jgi:hypothetical protein